MIETDFFVWGTLYVLKEVYDHNPEAKLLQQYRSTVMDGDYYYEIAENAVGAFFADTRMYFNYDDEITTVVIYDPIITSFWKMCDEYERRLDLKPTENTIREDMKHALDCALSIPDYSYDAAWYSDINKRNGCRLVLLYGCDFNSHHMLPGAIKEAYDAFVLYTKQLREAISDLDVQNTDAAPETKSEKKKAE